MIRKKWWSRGKREDNNTQQRENHSQNSWNVLCVIDTEYISSNLCLFKRIEAEKI